MLTEINACREQFHRLVDENLDNLLCRLILGDRVEEFQAKGGRLLPFASPPAMFKGEKPASARRGDRGKHLEESCAYRPAGLRCRCTVP